MSKNNIAQQYNSMVASIEDARVLLSVLVQYTHDIIQNDKNSSESNNLSKIVLGFSKIQQFFILNDKKKFDVRYIIQKKTLRPNMN